LRLDKYLKVSRIIKRRSVAADACDAGKVYLNGKPAKASAQVKAGDRISVRIGANPVTYEVLEVKETAGKDAAASMSRVVKE
jgi:ribosomal 50S subunit-recycling heat shock protein